MSLAADAVQPFFVAGLTALEGRPIGSTLADLIGKQSRIGFDLDFRDADEVIVTDFRDPRPVLDSMASDISRFATAAFQTIMPLPETMARSLELPWSLVKAYYAAFYAAHAITRMVGESCSYFDRSHITRISSLAVAFGKPPGFRLKASVHRCSLIGTGACINSKSLREGTGGAHEAFWNVFGWRLNKLGEDILKGPLSPSDAQAVFTKLENLRLNLSLYGASLHSWLSVIRNDIQYRHSYGAWSPCQVRRQDRERLARVIGQWQRDPMDVDLALSHGGRMGEFVVTCAFIVALCRAFLTRIAERSQRSGRSFARLGPLAILRMEHPAAPLG